MSTSTATCMHWPYVLVKETEKALLLRVPDHGNKEKFPEEFMERWFPKSQVELFNKVEPHYASIPIWLCEKAELL